MHTSLCPLDLSIKGQCLDGTGGASNSNESTIQNHSFVAKSVSHAKIRTQMCNVAYQRLNVPHLIATISASIMTNLGARDT